MLGRVIDVLFPRACVGCGSRGWPFCGRCLADVAWLVPPGCLRCGRPLEVRTEACADCPPAPLASAGAPFLYAGPVRRALMRLKFGGDRSVAGAMAPFMAASLDRSRSPDQLNVWHEQPILTWVPLGRRRRRARTFDQAEALAGSLAALVGLPAVRTLERVVETVPQARRSGPERRRALRGAFRAVSIVPRTVVLVDDVLTSGSTAAACAEALAQAGASTVVALTAARSLGGPLPARCYDRRGSGLGLWLPGGRPR